jgi:hypothetical protein
MQLTKDQAIIRCDTPFGVFDYFLIELRYDQRHRQYYIYRYDDINQDELKKAVAGLVVDFQNKTMRAYTVKGSNLRNRWKEIETNNKVTI